MPDTAADPFDRSVHVPDCIDAIVWFWYTHQRVNDSDLEKVSG